MKPTLALSILLAMSASALAQTPTVVEKPATKVNGNVKAVAHTPAKPSPLNVKAVPVPNKSAAVSVVPAPAKTVAVRAAKPASVQVKAATSKPSVVKPKPVVAAHPIVAVSKPAGSKAAVAAKTPFHKPVAAVPAKGAVAKVVAVHDTKTADNKKPEPKKVSAAGRRDPFISPVVNMGVVGSGCSSGKRCLSISQVALRGVVKSENGMIAVVVNAMDKAYFLRENDPVFDGYVVKITGDSIVFKETFKDKLGKPLTRDVTKTISRPVA